jgi:polyisoprenoid-binding protein YceI
MASYRVESGSSLVVRARSSIHDTDTKFSKVTGTVEADPDTLESAGAKATFTVEMAAFDAGDFLKNRKLKKDLELASYPTAEFELTGLRDVNRNGDSFEAVAIGTIRYRGREKIMEIRGTGTMTGDVIEATGSFDMDIRDFGMKPPKILMFKVEPEVTIDIALVARRG